MKELLEQWTPEDFQGNQWFTTKDLFAITSPVIKYFNREDFEEEDVCLKCTLLKCAMAGLNPKATFFIIMSFATYGCLRESHGEYSLQLSPQQLFEILTEILN